MEDLYINENGEIYSGDMQDGDRLATQEEIDAYYFVSDEGLEKIRADLYKEVSDPILVQVMRGVKAPVEVVNAVAMIKFENRYSTEADKSFDDFFDEVAAKWNEANPDKIVSRD